jgi:NAD(P)H-nitrite reductase large subunit
MNYVVIGNSSAAIGCVEGIRQIDKKNPITIFSAEKHHVYGRPLISYLLWGKTTRDLMAYRPKDFYKKNNCVFMPSKTVTKIDPKAKKVFLEDGKSAPYDKLLVASGSRPFVPPMQGLDEIDFFSFMTLDNALALDKVLSEAPPRVLIVGAGLIGMKCAEGIAARTQSCTVIELAPRVLPLVLDQKASSVIQKEMEAHNVSFVLGDSVAQFMPRPSSKTRGAKPTGGTAITAAGAKIEFDALVTAVGVRPNVSLVSEAGGAINKGIAVDDEMRTNIPDVFAAGDCAESFDITSGEKKILALLPNAYMQGETAGINMAGGKKSFINAVPMNAAGFFDVHVVTAGSYTGEGIEVESKTAAYKKFFVKDGLLKGYIIIGEANRAGIYTALIREQTPLDSLDFESLKTAPALMPFGKKARFEMLSGGEA